MGKVGYFERMRKSPEPGLNDTPGQRFIKWLLTPLREYIIRVVLNNLRDHGLLRGEVENALPPGHDPCSRC